MDSANSTTAGPLTVLTVMGFLPNGAGLEWLRRIMLVVGLVPALGAAVYKGVLFSTTAQPGWSRARWLGGYFANSALLLGAVELLLLATLMGPPKAAAMLRFASMLSSRSVTTSRGEVKYFPGSLMMVSMSGLLLALAMRVSPTRI